MMVYILFIMATTGAQSSVSFRAGARERAGGAATLGSVLLHGRGPTHSEPLFLHCMHAPD